MKAGKMKLSELILDFSIYPRVTVDAQHVTYLREAEEAGAELPPVIIDAKSKRVIDGFHRVKGWRAKYRDKPETKVPVLVKEYRNEQEILLDAIRYNSSHGRTLTRFDRTHCVLLAERVGIEVEHLASALSMTVEKIGQLRTCRVGELRIGKRREAIPLKRTISHMSGYRLTKAQKQVNDHLGGMNQAFYANQLIMLIEADLIDLGNEALMKSLAKLYELLGTVDLNVKAVS